MFLNLLILSFGLDLLAEHSKLNVSHVRLDHGESSLLEDLIVLLLVGFSACVVGLDSAVDEMACLHLQSLV